MTIFREKILLIFLVLSGVFILVSAALVFFNVGNFGSPVILHFDVFRGVDLLGEISDLWLLLISAVIIVVINGILAETLFHRERSLSYLLLGSNVLLTILLLAAVAVIISVN